MFSNFHSVLRVPGMILKSTLSQHGVRFVLLMLSRRKMTFLSMRRMALPLCMAGQWASASRLMAPASAFRHPTSQSGTGAFRYRTRSLISKPDWLRHPLSFCIPVQDWLWHRLYFCIPVPDWPNAGQYTLCLYSVNGCEVNLRCDVEKKFVNAGMPEFQEKVSPATAFLPVVSPTSAFRHQDQSAVPLVID